MNKYIIIIFIAFNFSCFSGDKKDNKSSFQNGNLKITKSIDMGILNKYLKGMRDGNIDDVNKYLYDGVVDVANEANKTNFSKLQFVEKYLSHNRLLKEEEKDNYAVLSKYLEKEFGTKSVYFYKVENSYLKDDIKIVDTIDYIGISAGREIQFLGIGEQTEVFLYENFSADEINEILKICKGKSYVKEFDKFQDETLRNMLWRLEAVNDEQLFESINQSNFNMEYVPVVMEVMSSDKIRIESSIGETKNVNFINAKGVIHWNLENSVLKTEFLIGSNLNDEIYLNMSILVDSKTLELQYKGENVIK